MTRRAYPVFHTITFLQLSALVRFLRLKPKCQPTTVLLSYGFMHFFDTVKRPIQENSFVDEF